MIEAQSCLKAGRRLTLFLFVILSVFYINLARAEQANKVFSYICSNAQVYSVRAGSAEPAGFTARGPWFKLHSFCSSSIRSASACSADRSTESMKCYGEYKSKGNTGKIAGKLAIWPSRIRHSPSQDWFAQFALPPHSIQTCVKAAEALGCKPVAPRALQSKQLKCIYAKSSFNNRDSGRDCFLAISMKLAMVAKRSVAGTRRPSAYVGISKTR